jgi:hypothetical protein
MNPNEAQVTHFDPQAELDALAAELAAKARAAYNDSVFVSDVVVETYLTEAERRHIAAANPANVLALLAERETLRARADRLAAENAALTTAVGRYITAKKAVDAIPLAGSMSILTGTALAAFVERDEAYAALAAAGPRDGRGGA